MSISTKQERITPVVAQRYLEENTRNRPLRRATVKRFAAAMRRDEWLNNGETIKFNGSGCLIDGQHRLAAIVEADRTIEAIVVRGLMSDAQETVDTGVRRHPSDVLALRGYAHGAEVSAAARAAYYQGRYDRIVTRGAEDYPTHQQIVAIAEADTKNIQAAADFAVEFRASHPEFGLSAPMVAEMVYTFGLKSSPERAMDFFRALVLAEDGPTRLLRHTLVSNKNAMRRLSRAKVLAFCIKAFNAWVMGSDIKRLRWKRSGTARETFPIIVDAA